MGFNSVFKGLNVTRWKKTGNDGPAKDLPIYRVYETVKMFIDVFCVGNCYMNSATELTTPSLIS